MNSMELVRFVSTGARPSHGPAKGSAPPFSTELVGPVRNAILRARQFLLAEQRSDGTWVGRQTSDASLPSQLIFWLASSERENSELAQQCAATIFSQLTTDGGWSLMPDGPPDVSTSVQAYLALKLVRNDPSDERLERARQVIRQLGGADAADATTRFILALFGQISYDLCPAMPPERFLFGVADRSRGPLSIIWSHRTVRDVGIERGVRELFIEQPGDWPAPKQASEGGKIATISWSIFAFAWQPCERRGWTPLRRRAIDRVESQLIEQVGSTRIGELRFDELIWHMLALQAVGFAPDSGEMQPCENRLRDLVSVDEDANLASPQHCPAPLIDTALVVRSLLASGALPNHAAMADAIDNLSSVSQKVALSPGVMDLCGVLTVLRSQADSSDERCALPPDIEICWDWSDDEPVFADRDYCAERMQQAAASCIEILLRRQNCDGGWGETAASRSRRCKSAPDLTGTILESLRGQDSENVQLARNRAIAYLRASQRADGSWTGGSAMGSIHGTSLAVRGLLSAGVAPDDDAIAAGLNWLIVHQQPSGGWCEQPQGEDGFVRQRASASQTAFALLALVAAGKANHRAARRGVDFLLEIQDDDGCWIDGQFMLHDAAPNRWFGNDLHAVAWPLLALSQWVVAAMSAQSAAASEMSLRLVGARAED